MRDAVCPQQADAAARAGVTCGPTGSSGWGSVGVGFVFVFALLEPEALAIHPKDMDVMSQEVEKQVF